VLQPLSRLFYQVLNLMKFGEHRGGMFVRARGLREGRAVEMSLYLLAEGDDGPLIPSMAIEAILRKLLTGERPQSARPATRALELADYAKLFGGRRIFTGFRDGDLSSPIYRRTLGSGFERLPAAVRALHDTREPRRWQGSAQVRRGEGLLGRIIGSLIGFPQSGDDVPVVVTLEPGAGGETWTRNFGGKSFRSHQACGTGKDSYLIVERFGIVSVSLALVVDGSRLLLVPRRWSALGVPLPGALLPAGRSFETEESGHFWFDVEIAAPLVGPIVSYRGTLQPVIGR
jgi:hypothetical protein